MFGSVWSRNIYISVKRARTHTRAQTHTCVYCLTFMQKLGYSIWEICLCLNSLVNQENQLLEVLCYCLYSNSLGTPWLIAMVLISLLFCGKYLNSSDPPARKHREPLGLGAYRSTLCRLASKSVLLVFFAGGLPVHGRNYPMNIQIMRLTRCLLH